MKTVRVNQSAIEEAIASAHNDVRRLWHTSDPDLRVLHRGRIEGALEALLTLGVITEADARQVRGSMGAAIEHSTT